MTRATMTLLRQPRTLVTTLLSVGLAATALTAGVVDAAPGAKHVGVVNAHSCANLGVTLPLDSAQAARAQRALPKGFTLAEMPTVLVETSTCASATVNGKPIGRFYLSEAALSVVAPHEISSPHISEVYSENIFMLSQLDTNQILSDFKKDVGYRSEVTTITLDLGVDGFGRQATATADGDLAPTHTVASLTPSLLPPPTGVDNPGIVYKLWTRDAQGRFVVTTNANMKISHPAAGTGTVTVPKGTLLHRILGTTSVSGVAFSGHGSQFINDTYVFSR